MDIAKNWRANRSLAFSFEAFAELICKTRYTANAIENFKRSVRCAEAKVRGHFSSEGAVEAVLPGDEGDEFELDVTNRMLERS